MSNTEDKFGGHLPPETPETGLWFEEESVGVYSFPLPVVEDSLTVGQRLAALDPPEQETEQIGSFLVSRSPESHQEAFREALDFLVPDGTPVLASANGEIVEIVIENTVWGPSKEFRGFLNYVTVKHSNGEFSQYCHLAKDSVPADLVVGAKISRGTQIAVTGKTGWTDRDHLHFMVFRREIEQVVGGSKIPNPYGFKSLKPRFEE